MKVGITSSSNFNLYASTLVCQLIASANKPTCILSVESALHTLTRHIRGAGVGATAKKILQRYQMTPARDKDDHHYFREYAVAIGLAGWDSRLSDLSRNEGIEYVKADSVNSEATVAYVRKKEIDILVNAGGGIFQADIIGAPRIGILNAHMGLLPAFRGMNVLEWSLFYEEPIGVTLHLIERGIDTGDILAFKEIPREEGDTIATLRVKSLVVSVALMAECIDSLRLGRLTRTKQRPQDGKQYFVMHPRLKAIVESRLKHPTQQMHQTSLHA